MSCTNRGCTGQEIEEEQLSKGAEKHDFSEKYQHKKQELLSLVEQ